MKPIYYIIIIIALLVVVIFIMYLRNNVFAFEGEICSGFTPFARRCFPGLICGQPRCGTGLDTCYSVCVRK